MSRYINFKSFYNKENFDASKGYIDPYEYHKTFYIFSKLFRILDDENLPNWTVLTPVFVSVLGSLAALICFVGALHNVYQFDVPLITESGTYFIIMIYKLLILLTKRSNLQCYHKLMQSLRDDFQYICTVGSKYRDRFFKNQLITFKASILAAIFTASIGSGIIFCANLALVFYIISHDESDDKNKPLPFPFWLFDVDFNKTPVYELSFIFSILCVISHTITYIFMLQAQIIWIRQIMSKADVIIWSIQDLLVDIHPARNLKEKEYFALIIKHRMRHIVIMHQSMYRLLDDYAGVFKKCLIFEQTFAGPLICLTAYCVAEQFDDGKINGILMLLCGSIVVLIFIPSYLCTLMAQKLQSVSDACWEISFWNAGPVIRPYLVIIMQRSVRPLPIKAAGFKDISLETYANTMTNAYKCFNMLRQANFDI